MNIKNLVKKIIFRFYQIKKEKNPFFEKYKNLPEFYILGSSPSLLNFDLKKLKNKPVLTLNNNFIHPDFNYFMKSEEVVKIHLVPPIHPPQSEKTWVLWFKEMEKKMPKNVFLFFGINNYKVNTKYLINKYQLFDNHKVFYFKVYHEMVFFKRIKIRNFNFIPGFNVGSSYGLFLLKYLNSKKIFMLGIDMNMIQYDDVGGYRFYKKSNHQRVEKKPKKFTQVLGLSKTIKENLIIKNFNDSNSKIYNCSNKSYLDMFPFTKYNPEA